MRIIVIRNTREPIFRFVLPESLFRFQLEAPALDRHQEAKNKIARMHFKTLFLYILNEAVGECSPITPYKAFLRRREPIYRIVEPEPKPRLQREAPVLDPSSQSPPKRAIRFPVDCQQ